MSDGPAASFINMASPAARPSPHVPSPSAFPASASPLAHAMSGMPAAAASPAGSASSLPMSARPQPEAGPSRSPRVVQAQAVGVSGSPLAQGSPRTNMVGVNGSPATGASNGNRTSVGVGTGMQGVLPGGMDLSTQEAMRKQLEVLTSMNSRGHPRSSQTPRAPSLPLGSSPAVPPDTSSTGSIPLASGASAGAEPSPAAPSPAPSATAANGALPDAPPNGAVPSMPGGNEPADTPQPGTALSASSTTTKPAQPAPTPAGAAPMRLPNIPLLPNGQIDIRSLPRFASSLTPEQIEMLKSQQRDRMAAMRAEGPGANGQRLAQQGQVASPSMTSVSTPVQASAPSPQTVVTAAAGTAGVASSETGGSASGPMAASAAPAPTVSDASIDAPTDTQFTSAPAQPPSTPLTTAPPAAGPTAPEVPPTPVAQTPVSSQAQAPTPLPNNAGQAAQPGRSVSQSGSSSGPIRPADKAHEAQRNQFLQTYASYHKGKQTVPHADLFKGGTTGIMSIGETGLTFELMELFLIFYKTPKIMFDQYIKEYPQAPLLQQFVQSKGLPLSLPQPTKLPLPVGSTDAARETTDTVEYLIEAFKVYLGGYYNHMVHMRNAQLMQRAQARAQAASVDAQNQQASVTAPVEAAQQPQSGQQHQPQQPPPAQMQPAPPMPPQALGQPPNMRPPVSINGAAPQNAPSASPGHMSGQAGQVNGLPPHVQALPNSATPSPPAPSGRGRPPKPKPNKLPPINTNPMPPVQTPEVTLDSAKLASKKRKVKEGLMPGANGTSNPTAPPPPKRPRWKVEYKPLKMPAPGLGSWEAGTVVSTFPKYNLRPSSRSIHDLKVVDMDAILMSLRSRLPNQLGYAITVLSMLSLTYPDESRGLPLGVLTEIFEELLELLAEQALGEDGLEGYKVRGSGRQVLFTELHRLGRDKDYSLEASEFRHSPDVILALLNLLRNFSMFDDNRRFMAANVDLLHLLVAVSDPSLCTAFGGSLYTVVELARIQRDAVSIYTNIGEFVDLRKCEWTVVKSLFRLLSSFLVPAWEVIQAASPHSVIYGPPVPEKPPIFLSIARAAEAFIKLAGPDANREVLARMPSNELVELFGALVKLLPVSPVQLHVVGTYEDVLCFTEFIAHALYSLAFLASPSTRTEMRRMPGAVDIVTRIILVAAPMQAHPQAPPGAPLQAGNMAVLGRRLAEMLGVLNGTWSPGGAGPSGMGFGAGGIEGKGWTFKSQSVEPGWLVARQETILDAMEKPMESVVWQELDNLIWGL